MPSNIGTAELTPAWQYEHFDLNNADTKNGLDNVAVRTAIARPSTSRTSSHVLPRPERDAACSPAPPGTWYGEHRDLPQRSTRPPRAALTGRLAARLQRLRAQNGKEMRMQLCTTSGNSTRLTELSKLEGTSALSASSPTSRRPTRRGCVFAGWADTTPTTQCWIYRGTYAIADFAYVLGGDLYGNYYYAYETEQHPSATTPAPTTPGSRTPTWTRPSTRWGPTSPLQSS